VLLNTFLNLVTNIGKSLQE